jgi:L,D-transpeptidase catalytic domain
MFADMAIVKRRSASRNGRPLALAVAIVVPALLLAGVAAGGFRLDQQLIGAPAGGRLASVADQQAQDDQTVRRTAADLAGGGASLDTQRGAAQADLATARNEAVLATWLAEPGMDRPAASLDRYGALLASSDSQQLALGIAGTRFFASRVHALLLKGMPAKVITISIHDQQLAALENGKSILTTPVTTGHVPDLATDMGPMRVLRRDSPWTMHSPWPKGSPYWYPDAVVQMVVWFTATGEGMHDAGWQTQPYGPGSNLGPSASHGCVHVPFDAEKSLFAWATVGTPVIVYPGDGSAVASQLQQRTVDDDGHPTDTTRGA